jgi:hypothetical protein
MKNIKFLLGLLTVVIVMASCATTQGMMDDSDFDNPRTQQVGNRVYMQDPYYGTVVLERDPYTGRYYDVTYGARPGYGYGYPRGGYNRGAYNRGGYYNRGSVNNRGGNYGSGNGNVVRPQAPTRDQVQPNREEARRRILGNN